MIGYFTEVASDIICDYRASFRGGTEVVGTEFDFSVDGNGFEPG